MSRWAKGCGHRKGKSSNNGQQSTLAQGMNELAIIEGEDETSDTEADDGIDPEVERVVKQTEFHSIIMESDPENMNEAKLMQVLTSPYIADTGYGVVALDPHALKKLFTTTHAMLRKMMNTVEQEAVQLDADVDEIEAEYLSGVTQHADTLYTTTSELAAVDARFREVAEKAVRIGDRLQKMEAQRVRAQEARQLLSYFGDFEALPEHFGDDPASMEEQVQQLPTLFTDHDRRQEAAAMLAKLQAVTYEMDAVQMQSTTRKIQAYSDYLENELLELFERAAGRSPPQVDFMREVSDIIFLLNQGDHLQSRYVFFVVSQKLQRAEGGAGRAGSDSAGQAFGSLSALFGRVISVCEEEFTLIQKVFPAQLAGKVIRLLLQRILNDPVYGVQARVEGVLSPQPPIDPLPLPDYLNCLCTVEQQTGALFDMLKNQEFEWYNARKEAWKRRNENSDDNDRKRKSSVFSGGNSKDSKAASKNKNGEVFGRDDDDGEGSGGSSANGGSGGGGGGDDDYNHQAAAVSSALHKYLNEQARNMFYEHRLIYPGKEYRYLLQSLLELMMAVWEGTEEMMAGIGGGGGGRGVAGGRNGALAGYGGSGGIGGGHGVLEYSAIAGSVSLESFPAVRVEKIGSYRMLLRGPLRKAALTTVFGFCSDAVRRCRTILQAEGEECEQRVTSYFQVVCRFLADQLLIPSIRGAHHLLPMPSSNAASAALKEIKGDVALPPAEFYEVLQAVNHATSSLQDYHKEMIAPILEDKPTMRTVVREARTSFLLKTEGAAAKAIRRAFEVVAIHIERQLSKGSKADYNFKDDSAASLSVDATKVVKTVTTTLKQQHALATKYLEDLDLSSMWETVGLRVKHLFIEHIRRSKVTIVGAFVLANDVLLLQNTLGMFRSERVDEEMQQLREVTNLFVVPPENLPSLMETGQLAGMGKVELKEFCKMRADYFTHHGLRSQWAKELFPLEDDKDGGEKEKGHFDNIKDFLKEY